MSLLHLVFALISKFRQVRSRFGVISPRDMDGKFSVIRTNQWHVFEHMAPHPRKEVAN